MGQARHIGISVYGGLMARRARIHYLGAEYHVMLRGNGGRLLVW